MSAAWLHVVGIGEDGWDGLAPAARAALEAAEVVIGGDRHHALAPHLAAERHHWPRPFREMLGEIEALRGRRVALLVTGDPLWFSAGAQIARTFPAAETAFHPQISAFQLAAARMRWSLADVETLTVHGRPPEAVIPFLAPGTRLLILGQDGDSPSRIARLLSDRGFGPSYLTALGALGGPDETRTDAIASDWHGPAPAFHTLAVECRAAEGAHPLPATGLPDAAFTHDGKLTKREMRVLTLAALAPRRGARLWDVGAGCGSVAIEWLRAARDTAAIAVEPDAARRAMAAENAAALGAPRLELVAGEAPEALAGLAAPDAVFIGGGLARSVVDAARRALAPHGRLVANAVTLESEALLSSLHAEGGGSLTRVAVARAEAIGRRRGWRAAMPVTQWVWQA